MVRDFWLDRRRRRRLPDRLCWSTSYPTERPTSTRRTTDYPQVVAEGGVLLSSLSLIALGSRFIWTASSRLRRDLTLMLASPCRRGVRDWAAGA